MREKENLTCEEAIRLLATYLDGELESASRAELEEHLSLCRSCYSRHQFEQTLKRQLADLGREPVRPEFEERVRSLVSRFTEDRRSARAPDEPTRTPKEEEKPWSS